MSMLQAMDQSNSNRSLNFSLDLPSPVQEAINDLQKELDEGDITQKGFDKKISQLLANYKSKSESPEELTDPDSIFNNTSYVDINQSDASLNTRLSNLSLHSNNSHNRLPISPPSRKAIPMADLRPRSNSTSVVQVPSSSQNSFSTNKFGGFNQITSQLEVPTRGVYPPPPNLFIDTNNNNRNVSGRDPRASPRTHFRSFSPSSGPVSPEGSSRPHTSYQRENLTPRTNGHHRNTSNLSDNRPHQRHRQFSPGQVDEVPHYLKERQMLNHRFEISDRGLPFSNSRMTDRFDSLVKTKDYNGGNAYSEPGLGLHSAASHHEFDYDKVSNHSRQSFDRAYLARCPSIDSSHQSIVSRDCPSFTTYADQKPMPIYPNIIGVLNHRTIHTPKAAAYTVIDAKGKEVVKVSWEKFHMLVDKYYQLLGPKRTNNVPIGSRVSLFFRKVEVADFLAACFGCFISGFVAVPIVATENLADFKFILEHSQSWAVLTTESNYKSIAKGGSDSWISQYEWLRPNDRIPQQFRRRKVVPFKDPADMTDLALIEYSKDSLGELRGIGISHRTLIAQCQAYREFMEARDQAGLNHSGQPSPPSLSNPNLPVPTGPTIKTLVIGIEPRAHLGLLLGGFIAPFCGFYTIFISSATFDLPEGFLNCLSKHRANYTIVDYHGLRKTVQYHQGNPTRHIDNQALISLEMVMIDTLIPDPAADQAAVTFFLKPFGCPAPVDALAPVCSLHSHGGMIVSIGEPSFEGTDARDPRILWLDRTNFRQERIFRLDRSEVPSRALQGQIDDSVFPVISFGCLLPEVTVIIVNPNDCTVCSPDMVGEIWVDSPSLSGGYWNMPSLTEHEFHAKAFFPDTLQPLEGEFLRTGLAGSLVDQQLVVFGSLDQRIRTPTHDVSGQSQSMLVHHGRDIIRTINNAKGIVGATAFEATSRDLPVGIVAVETKLDSEAEWSALVGQIRTLCLEVHRFTPFAVAVAAPGMLPRRLRNGADIISFPRTRQGLLNGTVPLLHLSVDARGHIDDPSHHTDDCHFPVPQHTGMEIMPSAVDERFGTDLEGFKSITQLLLWRATAGGDDLAFATLDARGKESKLLSFQKILSKALNLAHFLTHKKGLSKQSAVLIFMPPGLDYVISVHACLAADLIVIPYWDFDAARLHEEIPALVRLVEDFSVQAILVNPVTEDRLRAKHVQTLFKNYPQFTLPHLINVTKAPKNSKRSDFPGLNGILILVYFSPDMKRQCISFSPPSLLRQCKLHKYELGLVPSRPLVACGRVYNGIGFIHSALLGIYVGCPTLLLAQPDFAAQPRIWFEVLASRGCSAVYATAPMLRHADNHASLQAIALPKLRCLVVPMEGRLDEGILKLPLLDPTALAPAYTTPFHSLVSHRAFISHDPLILNLHLPSLRLGKVRVLEDNTPGLKLSDSGRVSRDTMVAIVNPVTGCVCQLNEIGEIWVASDGNADGLCFPESDFEAARFGAQIEGGDPSLYYVRTGDLGFLYPDTVHDPRPVTEIIATSPLLYVLGPMEQTFDSHGFSHYAQDVEGSVEYVTGVVPGGCIALALDGILSGTLSKSLNGSLNGTSDVLQEMARVAIIVEVPTTTPPTCHQLSLRILMTVLEHHGFIIDTIIYVAPQTLRRSRLGEKARFLTRADLLNGAIQPIAVFRDLQ